MALKSQDIVFSRETKTHSTEQCEVNIELSKIIQEKTSWLKRKGQQLII